jgi:hypothetical protein
MKIVTRIFIWILISLTAQLSGLFYVNNYFLSINTVIKTKKIVNSNLKKTNVEIKIPDNAKNVEVSFDAKYLSYYDGDVLKVVDTTTGEEKNVEFNSGIHVSFYKWLPDRDRMLIAEKEIGNQSSNFKLAYYDVDKNVKENIKQLDWVSKNAEVQDIQASPITNVIYVKVGTSGGRSDIYWINIMNEMKKIDTRAYMIGKIIVMPHEDKLLYEDTIYKKIYMTGQSEPLNISGVNNPSLLGVDDNDNVYIGETQDNRVDRIYYGSVDDGTNSLQGINLPSTVDKNDIFISPEGKVYINDNLKGIVTEVGSGKQYTYQGNFVQIYDGGIVSISNGKLKKVIFD